MKWPSFVAKLGHYGLVVSEFNSRSEGCGFKSCHIHKLDGNGVTAIPGSIPAPNFGSI
jgi:hypothetical protein